MKPLKIVFVANFQRRDAAAYFYAPPFILLQGLARAGHFVVPFSDRDQAREATIFARKKLGQSAMVRALEQLLKNVEPDLVLFTHADQFSSGDFLRLRETLPAARFAQINVDSPHRGETMKRFCERAKHMDASFITSADLRHLADLMPDGVKVHFFPEPLDAAILDGRVFDAPREMLARDAAFLGSKCVDRPEQIQRLTSLLPTEMRFEVFGAVNDTPKIVGADYGKYIKQTAMSPALQPEDGSPEHKFYASNRVALQLGHGVLTFVHDSTELDGLYEDGVALFHDIGDVAEQMTRMWHDDAERRRIAERGWRLAHERMSAEKVAGYLVDTCFGEPEAEANPWPTAPII
ncbi:MAG: glycosyltransferase [Rhodobacteraceae bacterium]|nr:glycosyltransferase [Paracoccaceae bacterium]